MLKAVGNALKATASFVGKWTGLTFAGKMAKKGVDYMAALYHGKFEEGQIPPNDVPEMMAFEDFDPNAEIYKSADRVIADPYLVLHFANAPSLAEGIKFTRKMTPKTREWCFSLGDDQVAAIRGSSVQDVAQHIRGEKTIDGLPKREAAMFGVGGNKGQSVVFGQKKGASAGPQFDNPASRAIASIRGEAIGRQAEWGASAGGWKPDEGAQWQKPQQASATMSRADRMAVYEAQQRLSSEQTPQDEQNRRRAA